MDSLPTRIPTKSVGVLELFFNKTPADLGSGARDVTELQPPQTQGLNTLSLAEYIITLGPTHPYYDDAYFFKKQWESGDCYICGLQINDTGHTMELEHVLPIAEALALTGIIQENRKKFTKPENLKDIAETPYAKKYLLEYARSHRCCNQIKSATSFLSFELSGPDDMKKYTPNSIGINRVLNDIWGQGTGTATKNIKWQEEKGCANSAFRRSLLGIKKNTFIESRRTFIINHYITPIIEEINDLIGKTTFLFAQLVFLANQAMSLDQSIWKTLSGQSMKSISSSEILTELLSNTKTFGYKNTREPVATDLINFIEKFPASLKPKAIEYINNNLRLSGSTKRQSLRSIDLTTLKGFLNIDYTFYTKIYFENITKRKENYPELTSDNEGLYGFQYMYYLLKNQDPSIEFTIKQYNDRFLMMNNVNKFMIYYIYIYIIFYNPFSILKRDQKIDNSPIDFSKIVLPTDIDGLKQFNLELQLKQGMSQIHQNFTSNIFSNFNYVIKWENDIYINIRELENYGVFIAESTVTYVGATDLIAFANQAYDDYNKELLNLPVGGMFRNNKFYKKTRKNNSTKRKQKTIKQKTRKNKKLKSKRKLRYTKNIRTKKY